MMDIGNILVYTGMGLAVTSSLGIIKIFMENDLVPKVKKVKEIKDNVLNNNIVKKVKDNDVIEIDYTKLKPSIYKQNDTTDLERRCATLIVKDIIVKNKQKQATQDVATYKDIKHSFKNSKYEKLAKEIFEDNDK